MAAIVGNGAATSTISSTSYPGSADYTWVTKKRRIAIVWEGSVLLTFSYDGTNDHGFISPSGSQQMFEDDIAGVSGIWFKVASSSGVVRVTVRE